MASQNDVRRIARSLPGAIEGRERFFFSVRNGAKERSFVWVWQERIDPKKARVPNPRVLAVRVADLVEKDVLLAMDKDKFKAVMRDAGIPVTQNITLRLGDEPTIVCAQAGEVNTGAFDPLDAIADACAAAPNA